MRVSVARIDADSTRHTGSLETQLAQVHAGEVVAVRLGLFTRTLRVVGVPRSRVGAKLLPEFCVELTPPEEFEKLRERSVQQVLAREKGSGRPTKRDRREIDGFFG